MGPDFRYIEHCTAIFLCLFWLHNLDGEIPYWIMSAGNCIRQFLVMIVRVETGNLSSLGRRHIGHTLNGAKVEFAILERVVRGNKFEGVYTEAGDAADGGGNASRTEEVKERMSALMVMDMEIPELMT